jgi:hypothetical protein
MMVGEGVSRCERGEFGGSLRVILAVQGGTPAPAGILFFARGGGVLRPARASCSSCARQREGEGGVTPPQNVGNLETWEPGYARTSTCAALLRLVGSPFTRLPSVPTANHLP